MADTITKWFFTSFIMNRLYNFNAGHITENISSNPLGHSRHVFFPENCIAGIEKDLINQYGEKVKVELYRIGKAFGFSYTTFIRNFTIDSKDRDLKLGLLFRFFETMYATKIEFKPDWTQKRLELEMDEFVVCRKNGLGQLFTEGSGAGLWASICNDKTIEAEQVQCQGNGAQRCKMLLAPKAVLEKEGLLPKVYSDFKGDFINKQYIEFNKEKPVPISEKFSIQSLLDYRFATYSGGNLSIRNQRFFASEITLFLLLQEQILNVFGEEGEKTIFLAVERESIPIGAMFKEGEFSAVLRTLQRILCATGFGFSVIQRTNEETSLYCVQVPCSPVYSQSKYPLLHGFISGFLKGGYSPAINVLTPTKHINDGMELKFKIEKSGQT